MLVKAKRGKRLGIEEEATFSLLLDESTRAPKVRRVRKFLGERAIARGYDQSCDTPNRRATSARVTRTAASPVVTCYAFCGRLTTKTLRRRQEAQQQFANRAC